MLALSLCGGCLSKTNKSYPYVAVGPQGSCVSPLGGYPSAGKINVVSFRGLKTKAFLCVASPPDGLTLRCNHTRRKPRSFPDNLSTILFSYSKTMSQSTSAHARSGDSTPLTMEVRRSKVVNQALGSFR